MRSRLLKILLLAVLILVAGFAMLLLAAKPYMIPTDSMRPTLLTGDYVFVTNTPGVWGSATRGMIRGAAYFNIDMALSRTFPLWGQQKLEARVEAFNVTNTPQFSNPGTNVSSMILNADGSIRSLGGYTEITGASGERQFRFALRISF